MTQAGKVQPVVACINASRPWSEACARYAEAFKSSWGSISGHTAVEEGDALWELTPYLQAKAHPFRRRWQRRPRLQTWTPATRSARGTRSRRRSRLAAPPASPCWEAGGAGPEAEVQRLRRRGSGTRSVARMEADLPTHPPARAGRVSTVGPSRSR